MCLLCVSVGDAPLAIANGYMMQKNVSSSGSSSENSSSMDVSVDGRKTVHMKKRLGLAGGIAMIVGTMIGNISLLS